MDHRVVNSAVDAGCRAVIQLGAKTEEVVAAFEELGVSLISEGSTGWRICVLGAAGGSGATTVACNLALEMTRLCKGNVALADLHMG